MNNKVKVKLIEIRPGIYKTTATGHNSGRLDFSELAEKISNPIRKLRKRKKRKEKII